MESLSQKLELLQLQLPEFQLFCGVPAYEYFVSHSLRPGNKNTKADLSVIIDFPWGYALKHMRKHGMSLQTVVLTDNPCCEYWEDVWDCQPNILLAGGHGFTQLAISMCDAVLGKRYKKIPSVVSKISSTERAVLSRAAEGKSNKEIALDLQISEYTVRNYLSQISNKLGFSSRIEAGFYYWGLWHLLGKEFTHRQI
ncbi:MAG: response regulator transcription factor [Pleurocapsa sp. SU_196_0]|nr:response regulator transcription factor [Pleurocapsa sp. SU_196_0]